MLARDIEMFIEHCGLKGLSTKTINSYEQTLRLFMQYMDEQGILQTEKITHLAIQCYIKNIKERGKYTVTTNPNSGNYQDHRVDFGKRVSDVTINNYLRNLRVFFNWCVEEELILRSPVKKGDFVKVERRPLEFVSDEDFKRRLKSMNSASFSEYRDSIIIQLLLDTRFIFDTNFSGDPNRDRYGSSRRRVNVVIPTEEQAQQLIEMGLNVKQTKPNPNYIYDEPFVPTFYVPVTVNMDSKWPPQVFWITTTGRKVACNAENIGQLDYIRVKNVNLQANLYENRNNPGQYTLYADILYVEQDADADPYAAKYEQREMAEPNDPNDLPY